MTQPNTFQSDAIESIAIMVLGSPYSNSSTRNALDFARHVLSTGRRIELLFFYHEGVHAASGLTVSSQDEQNLPEAWQQFIKANDIEAVVCIASALKRGIIDQSEADRFRKTQHSLDGSLALGGIGQWIEAVNNANKHIVFGA